MFLVREQSSLWRNYFVTIIILSSLTGDKLCVLCRSHSLHIAVQSPTTSEEGEIVDDIIFADSFQWLLSTDIVALHLSTEWRLSTPRLHCTVALPIIILFCSAGYCDRLWPVLLFLFTLFDYCDEETLRLTDWMLFCQSLTWVIRSLSMKLYCMRSLSILCYILADWRGHIRILVIVCLWWGKSFEWTWRNWVCL